MSYNLEYEKAIKYSNFGYYPSSASETEGKNPLHHGDKLHHGNQHIYADWLAENGYPTTSELIRQSFAENEDPLTLNNPRKDSRKLEKKPISEHPNLLEEHNFLSENKPFLYLSKVNSITRPGMLNYMLSVPSHTHKIINDYRGYIPKEHATRIMKDFEGGMRADTILHHAPEHYGDFLDKHAKTDSEKLTALFAQHALPSSIHTSFDSHDRQSMEALNEGKHVLVFPTSQHYKSEEKDHIPYFLYAPIEGKRKSVVFRGNVHKDAKELAKQHFNGLVQETA